MRGIYWWFAGSLIALIIGGAGLLWALNRLYLVETPTSGGSFTEGLVGVPRFVNPLFASSEPDNDLVALLFSGLLRLNSAGELIPDLAESYQVSEDGLTYTFTLKPELTWHDNHPLTAQDVIETIKLIQNPILKSPRFSAWEGVVAETVGENAVSFQLRQANPLFPYQTTIGLIPNHLWSAEPAETMAFSERNILAIGSGPFRLKKTRWSTDSPATVERYELEAFSGFALGKPKIKKINLRFFQSETELMTAYEQGEIDSLASPDPAPAKRWRAEGRLLVTATLSRIFGVFFNQNQAPLFIREEIRRALSQSLDRSSLISQVLHGFGQPVSGPRPTDTAFGPGLSATSTESSVLVSQIRDELSTSGWTTEESTGILTRGEADKKIELRFTLSTGNTPELQATAAWLKQTWTDLGTAVDVLVFDRGDLDLNIIRPRKYDALLFGLALGPESDLFPFWHSSQRLDPGSNLALYANLKTDELLAKARQTTGEGERRALYDEAAGLIVEEQPAVFLYAPEFIYAAPPQVKNLNLQIINSPSDRFRDVYRWYIDTERVWPNFRDETYYQ